MKKHLLLFSFLVFCLSSAYTQTTITIEPLMDNTLYENAGGTLSNGSGDHFFAGKSGGGNIKRGVIYFDIAASVPSTATITSVTLTLSMDQTSAGPISVGLFPITTAWGEGTSFAGGGGGGGGSSQTNDATWIHSFYPSTNWTTAGGDYVASASATSLVDFDGIYTWTSAQMEADVQSWLNAPASNFGWMVIGDESGPSTAKRFASREFATPADRPQLSITYTAPCVDPTISSMTVLPLTICSGDSSVISVIGNLNDATAWHLYSGSCGTTPVVSNTSGIFNVAPTSTTDYFVRGEGGCVTPSTCNNLTISVTPSENPSFSYANSFYCQDETDPSATITGTTGGTFSSTAGLSINSTSGLIDLSASTAGSYSITYLTSGTCPASASHNVTIGSTYTQTGSAAICNGSTFFFGTQSLTTPGVYTEVFNSIDGCDSTVTMTLIVNTVDTSVTVSGFTLTATSATATYQWMECSGSGFIFAGETAQSFTALFNGNYSVVITDNGCVDTSGCINVLVEGITDLQTASFNVFPNPATQTITILFGLKPADGTLSVMNVLGQSLMTRSCKGEQKTELNLEFLTRGIYFIQFNSSEKTETVRIVRE